MVKSLLDQGIDDPDVEPYKIKHDKIKKIEINEDDYNMSSEEEDNIRSEYQKKYKG